MKALGRLRAVETNLIALGKLANQAHSTLSQLELSNKEIDLLLEFGRDNAALGGKLSGAGGGGAFYLIMPDVKTALKTQMAMRKFAHNRKIELPFCECINYTGKEGAKLPKGE